MTVGDHLPELRRRVAISIGCGGALRLGSFALALDQSSSYS
jgi:hypothetical protein